MSYKAKEKQLLQDYLDKHPQDELYSNLPSQQVHHIFGKLTEELRTNTMNFIALNFKTHELAEFISVQQTANMIFDVQINKYGQAFIDFANKIAHKTWIVYQGEHENR